MKKCLIVVFLLAFAIVGCRNRVNSGEAVSKGNPESAITREFGWLKSKLIAHPGKMSRKISYEKITVVVLNDWELGFDTIVNADGIRDIRDSSRIEIIVPLKESGHYISINKSSNGDIYVQELSPIVMSGKIVGRARSPYGKVKESIFDVDVHRYTEEEYRLKTLEALKRANKIVDAIN